MSDPRAQLTALRFLIAATAVPERADWLARIDAIAEAMAAAEAARIAAGALNPAEVSRLRQDVEDAEHARDAANLQRMKAAGQVNTLHKALAAAAPAVESSRDAQADALKRIQWLSSHGGNDPDAAMAAIDAELEAPMPSRMLLELVAAGERRFSKPQLEFAISEAMVLTGWAQTPVELMAQGEPWLAGLLLKNHAEG